MRPRILDLYVFRYFISSYLICMVSFVGFFVLIDAFGHLDDYLEEERQIGEILISYGVRIPEIFHRLAPYLTLAAAGFTVTRLQKNNELTPMKALGMSVYRALAPVFLGALLLSGAIIIDQEWLIPKAETTRRGLDIRERREIHPNLIPDSKRNVLQIDTYLPITRQMIGVRVIRFDPDPHDSRVLGRERETIIAERGKWEEMKEGGRWVLRNVRVDRYDKSGKILFDPQTKELYESESYGEEGFVLETDIEPEDIESHDREIYYLTFGALNRLYKRQKLAHLRVKLHSRISYPVANLILLFLGLPFFLWDANRSVFIGSAICAAIGFSYFFINFLFMSMGDSGTIAPMTAAWMPTIFFGCLGVTLFDLVRS